MLLELMIFSYLCSHLNFHYFVWAKNKNKKNELDFIKVKLWSLNLSSLNSASKQGSCLQWSWPLPCSHTQCCTCYSVPEMQNGQPRGKAINWFLVTQVLAKLTIYETCVHEIYIFVNWFLGHSHFPQSFDLLVLNWLGFGVGTKAWQTIIQGLFS